MTAELFTYEPKTLAATTLHLQKIYAAMYDDHYRPSVEETRAHVARVLELQKRQKALEELMTEVYAENTAP